MDTSKFARKPFYVDAIQVTKENLEEVAKWCRGKIETTDNGATFILIDVHRPLSPRQTQAFLGDWILQAGSGFKIYTPKAFEKSFEKVTGTLTKKQADAAGIKPPREPRTIRQQVLTKEQADRLKLVVPREPKPKPPVPPAQERQAESYRLLNELGTMPEEQESPALVVTGVEHPASEEQPEERLLKKIFGEPEKDPVQELLDEVSGTDGEGDQN
jgi:hypothetical protein